MKVVITIQHPGHVHFYRHAIEHLQATGHEVHVFARDRPMALTLLDRYGIDYEVLTHKFDSRLKMALGQLRYERNLLKRVREIDPDVITAIGGLAIAHVSQLVDARSVLFTDTEHATLTNSLAFPFADTICTPDCYEGDIGPKQLRYPGYHELAYLHPDRFDPDPTVLSDIGIDPTDRFVILRLVDWNAAHDVGDSGFSDIESVVTALESTGVSVYITAEGGVPDAVERCQLPVAPHKIHHLMYYADLFIGEGATMATESAVLGTPGLFVSTIRLGYTAELADRYGLLANFDGSNRQSEAIEAGVSILDEYDQSLWDRRRQRMLADKIDTTTVILEQLAGTTPTAEAPTPDSVS
ncbi:DUF354 domain-containing protein [Halonotius roseus]|uniref:DUF354 domain-containing protein n=1 Tax=Halonotius roseus TaxID=2511997 RepID=A0A544QMW4_9EURY|nr:DUF354 domain-containing protein [Halonotius roseus]TQQ80253.1 DUF354 domain-containing protein [Halonotius roseus]